MSNALFCSTVACATTETELPVLVTKNSRHYITMKVRFYACAPYVCLAASTGANKIGFISVITRQMHAPLRDVASVAVAARALARPQAADNFQSM